MTNLENKIDKENKKDKPEINVFGVLTVGLASVVLTICGLYIGLEMYETGRHAKVRPIKESLWDIKVARSCDEKDYGFNAYMDEKTGEIIYLDENQRLVDSDAPPGIESREKGTYFSEEDLIDDWKFIGNKELDQE